MWASAGFLRDRGANRTWPVRSPGDTPGRESEGGSDGFPEVRKVRMIIPLEFIEAPVFTRLLPRYLSDDEYRELQLHLAADPEAGDVIQGSGGFSRRRSRMRSSGGPGFGR